MSNDKGSVSKRGSLVWLVSYVAESSIRQNKKAVNVNELI